MCKVFRAWPVLLVAASVGFLATRGVFLSYTIEEEHTEDFMAEDKPTVEVEVFNGSIKITRSKGHELHARLVKRAVGNDKPDAERVLEKIQVSMEKRDQNRFVFTGKYSEMFGSGNSGVYAELQVPIDTDVQLTTSNAGVTVTDIQGHVKIVSSNGSVRVQGNQAPVTVQTGNASIHIVDGRGQFDLKTSNGSINVKAQQASIHAKTSNSSINFQGTFDEGNHTLETSNGRIEAKLPPESQFQVEAITSNGKISTDFKVQSQTKPSRRPVRLQGTVGERPRFSLKLQTSNSGIALKHAGEISEE